MARKSSVGTPATRALERAGVEFTVHVYEHHQTSAARSPRTTATARPGGYGSEAAEQLGLDPAAVFKTLLVEVDRTLVVAVVPVSGHLDLKALAAAVGGKRAAMADPRDAERTTGYVVGGISPLGQRRRLRTVLDDSATALSTIYVSGGRRGLDVGLSPADLVRLLDAEVAPVARA